MSFAIGANMFFSKYINKIERQQLQAQLADWKLLYPGLGVLAILPEAEQSRVGDVQLACLSEGIPLQGAIFPKLIAAQQFVSSGVWLIGFAICPAWFLVENVESEQAVRHDLINRAIGHALEECGSPSDAKTPPTLFLIFDSMTPTIGSLLTGIYHKFRKNLSYAGVNAGSETFQPMPCLFDHEKVVENGLLGMILPDDLKVTLAHGYPTPKKSMQATSTSGNRIDKIDGKPAMEVYRNIIREEYGIEITADNFYDYAVHYPFGVVSALEVLVRIPVAFTEDGAIYCVGEIPPNSLLRLLRAPQLQESECVSTLVQGIAGNASQADCALLFYCAGRRMHFGKQAEDELVEFKAQSGMKQIAGALSLGEITSDNVVDFPEFHNAAMVCIF
jgi:hypothetical protein